MKRHIRNSIATLFGAAMIACLLGFNATNVSAQPVAWNPPCPVSKIINNTGCTADVFLNTNFGVVGPITVQPNGNTTPINVPPGTIITGIVTQAGTIVPVGPGTPIPPPGGPGFSAGTITGVVFGPAPGCCFDVYFDVANCYVWLFPGTPPCTP